ncbi:hypothetical protein APA_3989 [Pseudanabaena sp. lw0831]|nr:hypothetical protein APA_3989 [Pseudanabaena sp. lw0831]
MPNDRFRREVLSWFDERGQRYLTTDEQADIERQRANTAQEQIDLLLAKLRSLGISEE